MATLHLMIGLPCSGKTTYARKLADDINALVFTPDVWHLQLFGDDVGHAAHDERHDRIEGIMWDAAVHVLKMGGDVILDYGFWSRVERDDYRNRAKALGVGFKLHIMEIEREELFRRLVARNGSPTQDVFRIPKTEMEKYLPLFEPPTEDELREEIPMRMEYAENRLTPEGYRGFQEKMGWKPDGYEMMAKSLAHDLVDVTAMVGGELVGMGRLVGDGAMYWYMQDVFVLTAYQCMGIGSAIVNRLIEHVRTHSLPGTEVSLCLMAAKGKEGFYERLGFVRYPNETAGAAMVMELAIE